MKPLFTFFFILCTLVVNGQKNKHERWNQQLQKFVNQQGQVDYKGWMTEKSNLDAYIKTLEKMPPLETASKEAQLAYWINAYNALTIKLILAHYPLTSIRDIDDPWETNCFEVKGKNYTLGAIEHEVLRKMKEPRIHFAINCASVSCPQLQNEAYSEKQLETQLKKATERFLSDPSKNKLSASKLELSRIFLWFGNDFGTKSERLEFISNYSGLKLHHPKIEYLPYDWNLNETH
jgi:hypothetical protein